MQNQGLSPYKGYEYQIDCTIWCAMHLLFKQNQYDSILVEPVSGEDIEAVPQSNEDLDVISAKKVDSVCCVGNTENSLIIQIKSHYRQRWIESGIKTVLVEKECKNSKRPLPRKRAITRLKENPTHRYILITDGILDSKFSNFQIRSLAEDSCATALPCDYPAQLNEDQKKSIGNRIAFLDDKNWELINSNYFIKLLDEQIAKMQMHRKVRLHQVCRELRPIDEPCKTMDFSTLLHWGWDQETEELLLLSQQIEYSLSEKKHIEDIAQNLSDRKRKILKGGFIFYADLEVSWLALITLAFLKDPDAIASARRNISHENRKIRKLAFFALLYLYDNEIYNKAMADKDFACRKLVVDYIASLPEPDTDARGVVIKLATVYYSMAIDLDNTDENPILQQKLEEAVKKASEVDTANESFYRRLSDMGYDRFES